MRARTKKEAYFILFIYAVLPEEAKIGYRGTFEGFTSLTVYEQEE